MSTGIQKSETFQYICESQNGETGLLVDLTEDSFFIFCWPIVYSVTYEINSVEIDHSIWPNGQEN